MSLQLAPSLYHVKTSLRIIQAENEVSTLGRRGPALVPSRRLSMTQEDSQTEIHKVLLAPFDLIAGTSESTRAKTAETFLELLGARVRNPNTRSAYRVAWRSFLAFCSARQLELESVKAYHVGSWLDQHPGSRSTQRQHLAAVRLLFDSLMMRGVVEYNPAARARPPRLVRESSHTPVFEEAEIVAFLDSINLESLKDVRDKAIFSVLLFLVSGVCPDQPDGYRLLRAWRHALVTVPRKTRERTRGTGALEG